MSREDLAKLTRSFRAYVAYQRTSSFDAYQPASEDELQAYRERAAAAQKEQTAAQLAALSAPDPVTPDPVELRAESPSASPALSLSEQVEAQAKKVESAPKKEDASKPKNQLWKTLDVVKPTETFEQERPVAVSGDTPAEQLVTVRNELGDCQRCDLCSSRTNIVFGVGNPNARVMIVGEAPGFNEDKQAEPFVGKAGELLNKMIKAIGFEREEIYIANVLKCRPPNNRDPAPDEVKECSPFLKKQIAVIKPEVIIAMGKFASNTLAGTDGPLGKIRGRWHTFEEIPMMPTFHPAYLLRNESGKRDAWGDLQKVMAKLEQHES